MPKLLVDLGPVKKNRNFRLLILGQLVSLLGSNLTMVAIPYQVYRLTHSSPLVGLISFLQLPCLILGALYGGAYGDRIEKRRLLLLGTFVSMLVSLALGLNVAFVGSNLWLLALLAGLSSLAGGFTGPVRSAAIPSLLAEDQLVAGYSAYQVVLNTALVVGPSLAGLLLGLFGLRWCYFGDAASFVALLVATGRMDLMAPREGLTPTGLWRAITDGLRYVRSHAIAQAVYYADLNAMIFAMPRALFPAVALSVYHGGPRTLGALYSAIGVGAVTMGLFSGWIEHVRRRGRMVVLAIIVFALAMALFGLVHVLWIGLAALALAGAMDVVSTVLRNTILQLAIAEEYRSRISSMQMAVVQGGPRLGDLESGLVAGLTSTEFSIVSGAIACIVGVVVLARRRRDFWSAVA